jgi:hypothetical protein
VNASEFAEVLNTLPVVSKAGEERLQRISLPVTDEDMRLALLEIMRDVYKLGCLQGRVEGIDACIQRLRTP